MPDISKIVPVAGGPQYNLKDAAARNSIEELILQGGGDIVQDPEDETGGMISPGFSFGGALNAHVENNKLVITHGAIVSNKKLII